MTIGTDESATFAERASTTATSLRAAFPTSPAGALLMVDLSSTVTERITWLREALRIRETPQVRRTLGETLLEADQVMEAWQEYERGLDGLGERPNDRLVKDAVEFALVVEKLGSAEGSVRILTKALDAAKYLDSPERCGIFQSISADRFAAFAVLAFRLREIRLACQQEEM